VYLVQLVMASPRSSQRKYCLLAYYQCRLVIPNLPMTV